MGTEQLKMKCPKCFKVYALAKPEQPGAYQVKCPFCQETITLRLRPVEVKMQKEPDCEKTTDEKVVSEQPQTGRQEASSVIEEKEKDEATVPVLGKAELSNRGVYIVKDAAAAGVKSKFACPECGKWVMVNSPKAGKFYVKCNHCGTPTAVKVEEKSEQETEKVNAKKRTRSVSLANDMERGQLIWGGFFSKKRHELRNGATVLGRNDPEEPSDLMFDDPTMSCRSVLLEVDAKDASCKLSVMRATNPVYVNAVNYPEGSSIYLNFGDTLKMGRTTIVYNKV